MQLPTNLDEYIEFFTEESAAIKEANILETLLQKENINDYSVNVSYYQSNCAYKITITSSAQTDTLLPVANNIIKDEKGEVFNYSI